jgi:hypothetical protein
MSILVKHQRYGLTVKQIDTPQLIEVRRRDAERCSIVTLGSDDRRGGAWVPAMG